MKGRTKERKQLQDWKIIDYKIFQSSNLSIFKSLFVLWFFSSLVSLGFAGEGDIGRATFQVLELPFGARAAAMGGAFCGLADDITGMWWNPGGLGQVERRQAYFCHQEWFQDIREEYGGVVFPTYFGVVGGSFLYSSVGGIEGWTETNQPTDEFKTYEAVLSLSYARKLRQRLYIGLSLLGLYQNLAPDVAGLAGDKGKAIATNFGILWKRQNLGVGVSIQNIGTTVRYFYKETEYLPRTLKLGLSLAPRANLATVFDVNVPQFGEINYHFGGEYWLARDFLALRAGYNLGPQSREKFSLVDALSAGFGIRLKELGSRYRYFGDIELAYAYTGYGDLGMTHRIDLNWVFGPPKRIRTGELIVKIIDLETNKPLQAIITTTGTLTDTVLTSQTDGEFRFYEVPIGEVALSVQKDFFTPKDTTFSVGWYQTVKGEIALQYVGPAGIPPEKAVKGLVGRITTPQKEPILAVINFEGPDTSGTVTTDADGWYTLPDIPPGKYTIEVESQEHKYFPEVIEDVIVEAGKAILAHCKLSEVKILRLYFESDRAYVHPTEFEALNKVVDFMERYKENDFEIHGHTDPRPTRKFKNNIELSEARAKAVYEYLVRKGIAESRLTAKGWGAENPIAPNDTEEGMALNRRIEIIMKAPH